MCILAVTVQYQAATGKTQPWRHGSVTVEAQSGPAFGLALAGWDTGMLLYCEFYHLVANQFDTVPQLPWDLYETVSTQYVLAKSCHSRAASASLLLPPDLLLGLLSA